MVADPYTVDLHTMRQTNTETGTHRAVRRRVINFVPGHIKAAHDLGKQDKAMPGGTRLWVGGCGDRGFGIVRGFTEVAGGPNDHLIELDSGFTVPVKLKDEKWVVVDAPNAGGESPGTLLRRVNSGRMHAVRDKENGEAKWRLLLSRHEGGVVSAQAIPAGNSFSGRSLTDCLCF